jgi:hypothetical protein
MEVGGEYHNPAVSVLGNSLSLKTTRQEKMVNSEATIAVIQTLILWSSKQPSSYQQQVLINYYNHTTNQCNFIPKRKSK